MFKILSADNSDPYNPLSLLPSPIEPPIDPQLYIYLAYIIFDIAFTLPLHVSVKNNDGNNRNDDHNNLSLIFVIHGRVSGEPRSLMNH